MNNNLKAITSNKIMSLILIILLPTTVCGMLGPAQAPIRPERKVSCFNCCRILTFGAACGVCIYGIMNIPSAITNCSLLTVSSCGTCPRIVPQLHLCSLPYDSNNQLPKDLAQKIQAICPGSTIVAGPDPSCERARITECVSFSDALTVLENCAGTPPSNPRHGKHAKKE